MSKRSKKNREPYQVIEDFFSFASLKMHRKYISSMLKASYSEDYWKKSDPGSLLFFQERIEELMRATYLLTGKKNKTIQKKEARLKNEVPEAAIDPVVYVGWPKWDAMWEFFPRSLSKKEFINPYIAFEKFFDFKNLNEWLTHFKELINYALSPYGKESALDIDYLQTNNLLQKLIEASHLIHVRVNKPGLRTAQETNQKISGENLAVSEIVTEEDDNYPSDPYKVIDRFFMDGDIQDGRDDILRLFEAAFSDDLIAKKHYPSILVFTFERFDKLIDAALNINLEKENEAIDETKMGEKILTRSKTLHKKTGNWDLFPYKLKPYEWVYPRLAIKAFFEHQSVSHWKGKLHEILQAAIRDESICTVISDRSRLYLDCEHLERLVEAMWVIKVMEL